jgi:phosphate transport system substrate-binding protein
MSTWRDRGDSFRVEDEQLNRIWLWKRLASIVSLLMIGSLVLAACGGDDPTATPQPAANTPAPAAAGLAGSANPAAAPGNDVGTNIRISGPYDGEAGQLNGAGATFPAVLYSRYFFEYENVTGVKVNYQSIGSGGGIRSIIDNTVDFGATDGPMNAEQKEAGGGRIFHIPMALGAVVPTYNIPELGESVLNFTPETISGIYLGQITRWNDPLLVADNPELADIDRNILVIHRSDGSGTTFIWVDYLSTVNEEWRETVGVGTSVNWPTGLGGNGNEGVAGEVRQNPYSIGYVELIYALQNQLGLGAVRNKAGNFIVPTVDAVTAAAAGVAESIQDDLEARIVNADGEDSYPVSGFTWLLVREDQDDEAKAIALTRMLWWALTDAQAFNADLGYAPLPDSIREKALAMVLEIKYNGEQAFPGE